LKPILRLLMLQRIENLSKKIKHWIFWNKFSSSVLLYHHSSVLPCVVMVMEGEVSDLI